MNNYLFFRTDRIGDFLLSAILIKAIKRGDPTCHITVVCSSRNYEYVKKFHLVDKAVLYPKKNFIKKIIFYFNIFLKKRDCTIVCDGKKRSIYPTILSRSEIKILFTTKPIYKKILKIFFNKILLDNESETKILEIKNVIDFLKFNYNDADLNTINLESNIFIDKKLNFIKNKNFILLHFDEKWMHDEYIKSYEKIEPSFNQLNEFILNILSISNKNLIITSGIDDNPILNKIKLNFEDLGDNIFKKKINLNYIVLLNKLNFLDVQHLVAKSKLIIASHGAITHVAGSLNVPIFDIIDKSESDFFYKWSSHFKNYKNFYRKKFDSLSKEILSFL